ncbi:hypothetical protein [Thiocapsa sp. UBA6158]|jgi:hypothetical protein|uniref:hypothetical protein n=1 Tax=Thiocapsa sp. UBA6158 TaxID=1947692 RepID=UPI0025F1A765|nr:hypothetical protein [Thiocapsa sp. UBA6158]
MADIFSVTAPLALRCPDGTRKVIAACFPHSRGLLYLESDEGADYPRREQIRSIARRLGASI